MIKSVHNKQLDQHNSRIFVLINIKNFYFQASTVNRYCQVYMGRDGHYNKRFLFPIEHHFVFRLHTQICSCVSQR